MSTSDHQLRQALHAAFAIAVLVGGTIEAQRAHADSATMRVTATIRPLVNVTVLSQPSTVMVTAKDISRGYLDLPTPLSLEVKNNTPGLILLFSGYADFVQQARVTGLGTDVQMGADGGGVRLMTPGLGMNKRLLNIGFRLELAKDTKQGVYPWPFSVSAVPL